MLTVTNYSDIGSINFTCIMYIQLHIQNDKLICNEWPGAHEWVAGKALVTCGGGVGEG